MFGSWGFRKKKKDTWPRDEQGNREAPAFLEHVSAGDMALEMEVNMLESFGIPVVQRYPGDGEFGKVMLGMPGFGADLYVPQSMLEDARNILSAPVLEEGDEFEDAE